MLRYLGSPLFLAYELFTEYIDDSRSTGIQGLLDSAFEAFEEVKGLTTDTCLAALVDANVAALRSKKQTVSFEWQLQFRPYPCLK